MQLQQKKLSLSARTTTPEILVVVLPPLHAEKGSF